jgi:NhaP-type Na+/H+ or K+/H+ antiporter
MDNYEQSKPASQFWKVVWENLIQILAGIFVLVALIITWNSTEATVKVGVGFITLLYLLIRVSVLYQTRKFRINYRSMYRSIPNL